MNNFQLVLIVCGVGLGAIAASLMAVTVVAAVDKLTDRWAND